MGCTLSQKLADDDDDDAQFNCSTTNFSNSTASDGFLNTEDKDLIEKLKVQLKEKDEKLKEKDAELEKNEQELSAKLKQEKARAAETQIQSKTDAMDQLKAKKLAMKEKKQKEQEECQQMIKAFQTAIHQSFPLRPYYYMKAASGLAIGQSHFFHADNAGQLRASGQRPIRHAGYFRFTKNTDSSYSIYSISKMSFCVAKYRAFPDIKFMIVPVMDG